jgi:hypothetical protein
MKKLAILVLGEQESGKSSVWYSLFEPGIRTGKYLRLLDLGKNDAGKVMLVEGKEKIDVFLINGSPEETGVTVEERLEDVDARVVLCSTQYSHDARQTMDYFIENEYEVSVYWLNPGVSDTRSYFDYEGLAQYLMFTGADVRMCEGAESLHTSRKVLEKIFGWASYNL